MPVDYLRTLTAPQRTRSADVHLGVSLAFVAGAVNAGGFLAVNVYTSHMTGLLSGVADDLALGRIDMVILGLLSLISFVAGAAASAVMINICGRRQSPHLYAWPLLVEALMLLAFGMMGSERQLIGISMGLTVALLCFLMGWQNAMITKISRAEIRTTHVTGMVTDIGIELGKLLYWNHLPETEQTPAVRANRAKLTLLLQLVGSFGLGGLLGALGFKHLGYIATVPLALVLASLAAVQFLPDRRWGRSPSDRPL